MVGIAIRYAVRAEAAAIAELVNSNRSLQASSDLMSPGRIAEMFDRGDFLVLERPGGGLAAAVFVSIGERVAEVDLLSVATDIDNPGLPRRLLGVAEMVCAAHGCSAVERRFASTYPQVHLDLGQQT